MIEFYRQKFPTQHCETLRKIAKIEKKIDKEDVQDIKDRILLSKSELRIREIEKHRRLNMTKARVSTSDSNIS